MPSQVSNLSADLSERLHSYPLLEALIERRSCRFGKGMSLNGGPLAYKSTWAPQPLTLEEEAALAFAASGITGYALAELPYQTGDMPESSGGNIMTQFVGRTAASADALHNYTVFVINDSGVWMLKRPQDFPRTEMAGLIQAARDHRLVELYEKSCVHISDRRPEVPREAPFTPGFNKWSANVPGTTYFLPVAELTAAYINGLLFLFGEEYAGFILDDHRWFLPAGLARFARSRGGHLFDNPRDGRAGPLSLAETWVYEFATVELGGILQNLALMTQALGLGGFAHLASHPFIWLESLGFRMENIQASRIVGLDPVLRWVASLLGKDILVRFGDWTGIRGKKAHQTLLPSILPKYGRGSAQVCGIQVRGGQRHLKGWGHGDSVAGGRSGDRTLCRDVCGADDPCRAQSAGRAADCLALRSHRAHLLAVCVLDLETRIDTRRFRMSAGLGLRRNT